MATASPSTAHDHAEHGHHGPAFLQHHFDTPVQQFDAAKLGMWLFLAQEILFFSGLFVAYGIFRAWYPEAFTVGSHLLDWKLGAVNTAVLLLSSFTVAMAVRSAMTGENAKVTMYLVITLVCAGAFMVIKYFEYTHKIHVGTLPGNHWAPTEEGMREIQHALDKINAVRPAAEHISVTPFQIRSYFGIYFMMTGVHGLHVLVGMGVFVWIIVRHMKGQFGPKYFTPIEMTALYWHLVDLIWIYLFPLLYLID